MIQVDFSETDVVCCKGLYGHGWSTFGGVLGTALIEVERIRDMFYWQRML